MKKIDLQLFAAEISAVKGSRLFIKETTDFALADEVLGVRNTSDKGATPNQVESTTIRDVIDKNVVGTTGASEVSYTFALSDETVAKQMEFINKEVWIYEELEDTSSQTEFQLGSGILMKVKLSGLVFTGAEVNNLREFTQSGSMVSDDYYYGTYDSVNSKMIYKGANTGKEFDPTA